MFTLLYRFSTSQWWPRPLIKTAETTLALIQGSELGFLLNNRKQSTLSHPVVRKEILIKVVQLKIKCLAKQSTKAVKRKLQLKKQNFDYIQIQS